MNISNDLHLPICNSGAVQADDKFEYTGIQDLIAFEQLLHLNLRSLILIYHRSEPLQPRPLTFLISRPCMGIPISHPAHPSHAWGSTYRRYMLYSCALGNLESFTKDNGAIYENKYNYR